jgi:hypothetical protein
MPDDPSDSAYDLAPVPQVVQPHVEQAPIVLEYRRVTPIEQPPTPLPPPAQTPISRRWVYRLRAAGAMATILFGICLMRTIWVWVAFLVVAIGIGLLMFSGPDDSEKRGYHF